ncbi:NEDD4-binding protein 3-like protein [Bienertia sinuspersici]
MALLWVGGFMDAPIGLWADEVDDIRHLQFKIQEYITEIAELQMSHEMVEEEYKKLKKKYDKQQEELEEFWMENATIRDGLYSANADKRLMLALIVSWVFFAAFLLMN